MIQTRLKVDSDLFSVFAPEPMLVDFQSGLNPFSVEAPAGLKPTCSVSKHIFPSNFGILNGAAGPRHALLGPGRSADTWFQAQAGQKPAQEVRKHYKER